MMVPLVEHFNFVIAMAFLCGTMVCAIAAVAGIGGGGILVPLFSSMMDIPVSTAVGMSQSIICGQSAVNICFSLFRKHSETLMAFYSRPLINYQYLSLVLPLALAGTLIGGFLGRVVPDWLRLTLLLLLLSVVLQRTILRTRDQFRQDKERRVHSSLRETHGGEVPNESETEETEMSGAEGESITPASPVRKGHLPQFPRRELCCMLGSFVALLVCNAVRAEETVCGTFNYALMLVVPIGFLCLVSFSEFQRLQDIYYDVDEDGNFELLTFNWNRQTTIFFPAVAVVAGAAASMLGIGGGLVLGVVLYEAGLTPEEASASSAVATLLIACESALQMLLQSQIAVDYSLVVFCCGMLSSVIGQLCFVRTVRRLQLHYLIVLALAIIVGGSLITLLSYGIYDAVVLLRHQGSLFAFGHFCLGKTSS
jgi:uncharacterized membrane protein YfcA